MSIKKNFLYNSILTLSGYLFPLLTYPYVSRVLGVENIGICNFVDSIVNYFILFSMMGIGAVGMREISMHRDDKKEMSKHFSGLLLLNLATTIIAIIILLIAMYTIPQLFPYRDLLYIGVCKLFFNLFMIEWFYSGVEDFKYIAQRTITIRAIYVVLVFVFIKESKDYKLYYFLTISTYLLNGIINIIYSRKYVIFRLKGIHIHPYIATFLTIGFYMLITNIYTSLNVIWLGFVAGTKEVGYYTTATKLYTIILALFTALTNVVYPRVTYLYAQGQKREFWEKIEKVVSVVFAVSIPMSIMLVIYSPNLIHVLAGNGYEGAYLPFRIIAPLILIIGYEQILVIQILMSMKYDKQITINASYGAIISIVLNLLIVRQTGAIGTSFVWFCTEITILTLSLRIIYQNTPYRFPLNNFLKQIAFNIPLFIILFAFKAFFNCHDIILILLATFICIIYTLYVQIKLNKNELITQTVLEFNKRITNIIH